MNKPELLFHYCGIDKFLSITSNKTIWLSDVSKSNDYMELTWIRKPYYNYILKKFNKESDPNIKKICNLILCIAYAQGYDIDFKPLLSKKDIMPAASFYDYSRVYAFCFSEIDDSLGQWRGYADDGHGICIGFNREYFDAITENQNICPREGFIFSSVDYEPDDIEDFFEEIFNIGEIDTNDLVASTSNFVSNKLFDLNHIAAFFKNKSFQEEKEWRIIYPMIDYNLSKDILDFQGFDDVHPTKYSINFTKPEIKFTYTRDRIIPHLEIGIKNFKSAISKITIGPKSKLSKNDLRHYLVANGILDSFNDENPKIELSNSSYR